MRWTVIHLSTLVANLHFPPSDCRFLDSIFIIVIPVNMLWYLLFVVYVVRFSLIWRFFFFFCSDSIRNLGYYFERINRMSINSAGYSCRSDPGEVSECEGKAAEWPHLDWLRSEVESSTKLSLVCVNWSKEKEKENTPTTNRLTTTPSHRIWLHRATQPAASSPPIHSVCLTTGYNALNDIFTHVEEETLLN